MLATLFGETGKQRAWLLLLLLTCSVTGDEPTNHTRGFPVWFFSPFRVMKEIEAPRHIIIPRSNGILILYYSDEHGHLCLMHYVQVTALCGTQPHDLWRHNMRLHDYVMSHVIIKTVCSRMCCFCRFALSCFIIMSCRIRPQPARCHEDASPGASPACLHLLLHGLSC